MDEGSRYHLFDVFGVELEYAVVDRRDLAVLSGVEGLLVALGGSPDAHPSAGNVEADNELATHVLELRCAVPTRDLVAQAADFAAFVRRVNRALATQGACLMPGGMHPFMDPARESGLWPHEGHEIYQTYDRIFGCHDHGWLNLQSAHLNLPFAGDAEFARLHSAISLLLPLLPALAASSPIWGGAAGGWLDGRLFHYQSNQRQIPAIVGELVPEAVGSEEEYRERILAPIAAALAPHDREGHLEEEWVNSRAAIALFSRGAIEIRCLDTQERPLADLAIAHFVATALRRIVDGGGDLVARHRALPPGLLRRVFLEAARVGGAAVLPAEYPVDVLGVGSAERVGELLVDLVAALRPGWTAAAEAAFGGAIDRILGEGCLAARILRAAAGGADHSAIYRSLCACLADDEGFTGSAVQMSPGGPRRGATLRADA